MKTNDDTPEEAPDTAVPIDDVTARAEAIRKKYLYRRLILRKKTGLSHAAAVGLVGPDCAYHLYRYRGGEDSGSGE